MFVFQGPAKKGGVVKPPQKMFHFGVVGVRPNWIMFHFFHFALSPLKEVEVGKSAVYAGFLALDIATNSLELDTEEWREIVSLEKGKF